MSRNLIFCAVTALWSFGVVTIIGVTSVYEKTPGAMGSVPMRYPAEDGEKPVIRLLVFLHPQCPCSLATVAELQHIVAGVHESVEMTTWVFLPENAPPDWLDTQVVARAKWLKEMNVKLDHEAQVARKFGVATSGHVLVYDGEGDLRFSGGITITRGHEGDNHAARTVHALVGEGASGPAVIMPVYGCGLYSIEPES